MEALIFKQLLILTCYGAIQSVAIPETNGSDEVSDLNKILIEKIHDIENRYEKKLEVLRIEMMQNNKMLQNSVDELSTKLENERKEKSDAIQQLRDDFIKKETTLTEEINDIKNQLLTECKNNREVDRLKAVIAERMSEQIMDLKTTEKDDIASKSSLKTKNNRVEDAKTHNVDKKNKEAISAGFKRQTTLYGSTQVAFSARLPSNTPSLSPNQDIVFTNVLLNLGSAYHNAHGTFVAPVSGVYFFTTSLLAYGAKSHHAKIVKDGQELARVDFNDADNFDDSSQTVIVQLRKGDIVAVQNADYTNMVYYGYNYCTFSGFLLYEFEDMSPVVGK